MDVPKNLVPDGTVPLENQVAGHTFQAGTDAIGMLKNKQGIVLKPGGKPVCAAREIQFYKTIQDSQDPHMVTMRQLVPEFHGSVAITIGGRDIDFIKLRDLTHGMLEPCIMDVKIGKRTWDPLATAEKRSAEETKYKDCKNFVGFCVPGFQVYSIATGQIKRFGKEYGKKLNKTTLPEAFRKFLNADTGLCRTLLMQLLTGLWSILQWARTQKKLRLFSSSVLLVYDARRLKASLATTRRSSPTIISNQGNGSPVKNGTPTDGCPTGPFKWPAGNEPIKAYRQVQKTHSIHNNYDEDLKDIQESYTCLLDDLVGTIDDKEWAFVKMIDFAHAFEAEDETVDTNYLFGIENLVKIFEGFLKECE